MNVSSLQASAELDEFSLKSLPRSIYNKLVNSSKETIVLDGLKVGRLVRLACSLGPKFAFPTYPGSQDDRFGLMIASTQIINLHEFAYQHLLKSCQAEVQSAFIQHLSDNMNRSKCSYRDWEDTLSTINKVLLHAQNSALNFVKTNPYVIITESDKGKCSIISLKSTYNLKMENILKEGLRKGVYKEITACLPNDCTWEEYIDQTKQRITSAAITAHNCLRQNLNFYINGGTRFATV